MSEVRERRLMEQDAVVGICCDICGKIEPVKHPNDDIKGWHHFRHGHTDWGSDSSESVEWFDVCSVKCYQVQLRRSIEYWKRYGGFKVDEMDRTFAQNLVDALENGNRNE